MNSNESPEGRNPSGLSYAILELVVGRRLINPTKCPRITVENTCSYMSRNVVQMWDCGTLKTQCLWEFTLVYEGEIILCYEYCLFAMAISVVRQWQSLL